LKTTAPIDLCTASLDGVIQVPKLERSVELTIPPEIANGKVFRLRNLGQQERELFQKLRQLRK